MKKRPIFFVLLALSAALIAVGCKQGQPNDVLNKAITVCLECIGIG